MPGGAGFAAMLREAGTQASVRPERYGSRELKREATARDDLNQSPEPPTGPNAAPDLAAFQGHPARYRPVFENRSVVIYAPQDGPCAG